MQIKCFKTFTLLIAWLLIIGLVHYWRINPLTAKHPRTYLNFCIGMCPATVVFDLVPNAYWRFPNTKLCLMAFEHFPLARLCCGIGFLFGYARQRLLLNSRVSWRHICFRSKTLKIGCCEQFIFDIICTLYIPSCAMSAFLFFIKLYYQIYTFYGFIIVVYLCL